MSLDLISLTQFGLTFKWVVLILNFLFKNLRSLSLLTVYKSENLREIIVKDLYKI